MWPAVALLLLAGGALGAPTHALVPGDDGPPSVLRTNDAQHPRQHTAISALLPNDHERHYETFFCKKTRYHRNGKMVGKLFGGVWRFGQADQVAGVRFFKSQRNFQKNKDPSPWYVPENLWSDPEEGNLWTLFMDIPDGSGDYWKIEMDRIQYPRQLDAQQKASDVFDILNYCRKRAMRAK